MALATVFPLRPEGCLLILLITCPVISCCIGSSLCDIEKQISLPHSIKSLYCGAVFQVVSLLTEIAWHINWGIHHEKLNKRSFLRVVADFVTTVAFGFFATYVLSSIRFSPFRLKSDFLLESGIKPNLNLFILTTLAKAHVDIALRLS